MNEEQFVEAMSQVYALRDHARRVERSTLGLPPGPKRTEDECVDQFARWLWRQRSEGGKSVLDVLRHVLHGPGDAEDRLWSAIRDPDWQIPRLGRSTLGEIMGWARPNDFPPRNDRNNKALRALGHDVALWSA